ncbi:MAG: Sec-independent protein translocase protein TatC [Chlamydiae bacterium]|nr:Sec-independent protein translocase protein TatC [Chlamydiota bacterium]
MNTHNLSPEFWDHVEELRKTIIRCFITIALATALCFSCFSWLYPVITHPLNTKKQVQKTVISTERHSNPNPYSITIPAPPHSITFFSDSAYMTKDNRISLPPNGYIDIEMINNPHSLVILGPLEGITTSLKISLWLGLVISFPFWGFFMMQFLLPALKNHEKNFICPFAFCSLLFVFLGGFIAFTFFIPFTNEILQNFNQKLGINLWSISHYLNYTLIMSLSTIIASELVLVLFFLVHYGKINDKKMRKWRPGVLLGIFVLSAILTPPDILTQIILALPMAGIYELAILYAKIKRSQNRLNQYLIENF